MDLFRNLFSNVREMGVIGTLRQRLGPKGSEFQVITVSGEEVTTTQEEQTSEKVETKKKKVRGL